MILLRITMNTTRDARADNCRKRINHSINSCGGIMFFAKYQCKVTVCLQILLHTIMSIIQKTLVESCAAKTLLYTTNCGGRDFLTRFRCKTGKRGLLLMQKSKAPHVLSAAARPCVPQDVCQNGVSGSVLHEKRFARL